MLKGCSATVAMVHLTQSMYIQSSLSHVHSSEVEKRQVRYNVCISCAWLQQPGMPAWPMHCAQCS